MTRWMAGVFLPMTIAGGPAGAQTVDLDAFRFTTDAHRTEAYQGRRALVVGSGTAWLDAVSLRDVVIEFDMAVPAGQAFMGVRFRAVDDRNHEYYYLRPHQVGRDDATQYVPIFNGIDSWQIHTGPAFGAALAFPTGRWMHVKLVAVDRRLEVYIDSSEPVQVVPRLVREPAAGAVGFTAGFQEARFANIVVRPAGPEDLHGDDRGAADDAAPSHVGSARRAPADGARLVRRFRVSTPFAEDRVAGTDALDTGDWSALSWRTLDVEREGIANLARLHGNDAGNTVFAAVTLTSDRPRRVAVRIGFSDRVKAYLDGRPIFAAADEWRTRDFRFLGIIGLHDTLFLDLEPGANELWLAVSEGFGGWGVMLEIPDVDGLRLTAPGGG